MSFETRFEELKVEDFIAVDSHLDKGLKIDINTENLPGLARFTPSTPCTVHLAPCGGKSRDRAEPRLKTCIEINQSELQIEISMTRNTDKKQN